MVGATKRYGKTVMLDKVSLVIQDIELFTVSGSNGAGKITLVHILCAIHNPNQDRGRIVGFDVELMVPKNRRWLCFPYPYNVLFIERLLDGIIAVAPMHQSAVFTTLTATTRGRVADPATGTDAEGAE